MCYYIIIKINIIKTRKRRVSIGCSYSELVVVGDRYEAFIEEHLGVANQNPMESRLRRNQTVIIGRYQSRRAFVLME